MDPQILDLLGVEIEIRIWRNVATLIEAELLDGNGNAVDLSDSAVTFMLVERAGDTEPKYEQTNSPGGGHTNEAGGVTRFEVPQSVFDDVEGKRSFTWKYHIVRTHLPSGRQTPYFYGDARIVPLLAPLPVIP